ncbi:IS1/IS1595 family N-terminal zinc-binding domain-containing protein [Allocoleopsis sp.]|uniref:IS1/IS1595 family N-terminal zinc-binding domain-containing protein n=1 Tax=Allocoleopsis sp. TaxID=3088169 RepID=UPI002FD4D720
MKCPKCESTQLRKNGRSCSKQRYLCKACGRQFLAPLVSLQLPSTNNEAVEVATNEDAKPVLLLSPSLPSPPEVSVSPLDWVTTPTQSSRGTAILLLDAENLRLDINTEKFLAEISNYQLRVKIAFANWRNPAIGKLDAELYERGYQLIHVPMGQNSADAQMIAMGASIRTHYPEAKEVFVCSCDWLLTHLCNSLQTQGLTVYRVRRQDNILSVENRNTGKSQEYSLTIGAEIPSFEEFIDKINELFHAEHESLTERIARLSTVTSLFQERRLITLKENRVNRSLVEPQKQDSVLPVSEHETTSSAPNPVDVAANASVTPSSNTSIKRINSKEELEQTIVKIIASMQANSSSDTVEVSKLSAALKLVCGESANSVIKKLKIGGNFTKFLQSCKTFKVGNSGAKAQVRLSQQSLPEIK